MTEEYSMETNSNKYPMLINFSSLENNAVLGEYGISIAWYLTHWGATCDIGSSKQQDKGLLQYAVSQLEAIANMCGPFTHKVKFRDNDFEKYDSIYSKLGYIKIDWMSDILIRPYPKEERDKLIYRLRK